MSVSNEHPAKTYALVAVGYVLFGPSILAKPCDVAGNCIGWRKALAALAGSLVWVLAAYGLYRVVM